MLQYQIYKIKNHGWNKYIFAMWCVYFNIDRILIRSMTLGPVWFDLVSCQTGWIRSSDIEAWLFYTVYSSLSLFCCHYVCLHFLTLNNISIFRSKSQNRLAYMCPNKYLFFSVSKCLSGPHTYEVQKLTLFFLKSGCSRSFFMDELFKIANEYKFDIIRLDNNQLPYHLVMWTRQTLWNEGVFALLQSLVKIAHIIIVA